MAGISPSKCESIVVKSVKVLSYMYLYIHRYRQMLLHYIDIFVSAKEEDDNIQSYFPNANIYVDEGFDNEFFNSEVYMVDSRKDCKCCGGTVNLCSG